jgi:sugar porter (SP) family MFS transporter
MVDKNMPSPMIRHPFFIFLITSIAALSGLLFGFDTGVISGAIIFIKKQYSLTTAMTEWIVSAVLIGAIIGALFSGKFTDQWGRRTMLFISALTFIAGSLLSAMSFHPFMLMISRTIVGTAIGIASYTAPLYISEVAPASIRGRLIVWNTIAITGGMIAAYWADFILAPFALWRWMFGIGVIPAILLALGVFLLPQSPRWLIQKNQLEKARQLLYRIRPRDTVNDEITSIQEAVHHRTDSYSVRALFSSRARSLLIMGCGLAVIQQCTGINTFLYYAPIIFEKAGFQSHTAQLLATLGLGCVNFLFTIMAAFLIDNKGRRKLLLIGLSMMTMSLMTVGALFHFYLNFIWSKYVLFISILVFIAFYAISIGCIFWVMIAEIYPLPIRANAMSIAAMTNWLANLLMTLTFLSLIDNMGPANTFWLYGLLAILSWFFIYYRVPETKQMSLEEIEANLYINHLCTSQ